MQCFAVDHHDLIHSTSFFACSCSVCGILFFAHGWWILSCGACFSGYVFYCSHWILQLQSVGLLIDCHGYLLLCTFVAWLFAVTASLLPWLSCSYGHLVVAVTWLFGLQPLFGCCSHLVATVVWLPLLSFHWHSCLISLLSFCCCSCLIALAVILFPWLSHYPCIHFLATISCSHSLCAVTALPKSLHCCSHLLLQLLCCVHHCIAPVVALLWLLLFEIVAIVIWCCHHLKQMNPLY